MKKLSKYVSFIADGGYTVMFNLRNSSFIVLGNEEGEYVFSIKDSIEALQGKHPDLFAKMLEKSFVVDADIDEAALIVEEWERADTNPDSFSIIINPTLGCNLRCWYCYENHEHQPLMKTDVLDSIYRLIDNKIQAENLHNLDVSFFGGEPLLGFEKVVKPVLAYAAAKCREKDIRLASHFTTNGVLFTDEIFDFLGNVGLSSPASFQISLDGNRELHDKSRVGIKNIPTYDVILSNIEKAVSRCSFVNVRLNYTAENANSFLDVLDDFLEMPNLSKQYVKFNFQQIWQDKDLNNIDGVIEKIKQQYIDEGFSVASDNISHRHWCYADKENSVVINYDGNLFKCTARDFVPELCEGVLTKNGNIEWNSRYKRRMAAKYSNSACLACRIMPICNGGCSQSKLEKGLASECIRNMNEEDKDLYIAKRFKEVVNDNRSKKT